MAAAMVGLVSVGDLVPNQAQAVRPVVSSFVEVELATVLPAATAVAEAQVSPQPEPMVPAWATPAAPTAQTAAKAPVPSSSEPIVAVVEAPVRVERPKAERQVATLALDFQEDLYEDRKGLFRKRGRRGGRN